MKMDYGYTSHITDSMKKYAYSDDSIVDAVYTEAYLTCDRKNPFIECLPPPITSAELKTLYYCPFPEKCSRDASPEIQKLEIQRLREIRLPLPFLPQMEAQYYSALMTSHRIRFKYAVSLPNSIVFENEPHTQAVVSKMAKEGDTGIGLTLLGIGGCGKSEAISKMLSRYPQIIRHDIKDVGRFLQIVWLYVVTPSNANLSDLYIAIAEAVDDALGNIVPVYGSLIKSEKSVGGKAKYVAKLVRLFNISSIILDEIQNLDSNKNKESSYNSLMELINTTKIALVIVGTEEAYTMLCRKYYLARRTGSIIDASKYCLDRAQFNTKMKYIMSYNWFRNDESISPQSELLDALFEETLGVIDRMISLWTDIQIAYVSAKPDRKPNITPEFIKLVSNNTNPMMSAYTVQTLTQSPFFQEQDNSQSSPNTINLKVPESKQVTENIKGMTRSQQADNLLMNLLSKSKNPKQAERIYEKVRETLILLDEHYNDSRILEEISTYMGYKKSLTMSDIEITRAVLMRLRNKKSDKRRKPAKIKSSPDNKEKFIEQFS